LEACKNLGENITDISQGIHNKAVEFYNYPRYMTVNWNKCDNSAFPICHS